MSPYNELRKALLEELAEPGAITREEIGAVLDRFPELPDDPPPTPFDGLLRLG